MAEKPIIQSRRKIGVNQVQPQDVRHVRIFYDENMYAAHTNRGGIWNFGDGEITVAHLLKPCEYQTDSDVGHSYAMPEAGLMLNRSSDNGETWLESERNWIWNNSNSTYDLTEWLRPVDAAQREQIDLSAPDSMMHFCYSHYCRGGYGAPQPWVGFCVRSKDRGRTWEKKPSRIEGPGGTMGVGLLIVNLGHVRFDNGVLGVVGTSYADDGVRHTCFFVSYDNGVSWEFYSRIIASESGPADATGDQRSRYTYTGLHLLPDGRLFCCMHRVPGNIPCITYSEDSGMTWSPPQFIVGPESYSIPVTAPKADCPLDIPGRIRYRSPCALVLRDGRIIVLFARRAMPAKGGNGILGVVSDDLGETWSKEFVIRGDDYTGDCGYPVLTELNDGRIFTAYYFTEKQGDQLEPFAIPVRHIAGTFFKLD